MFQRFNLLLLIFLLVGSTSFAQEINSKLLKHHWTASWITCPDVAQKDYGVFHFRKQINLGQSPDKFIIHISADNRYRLFVNGKSVCSGPARGDLVNWYFETIDIAPYLQKGNNIIASTVWNMGVLAPVAQISNQTGFVIQGDGDAEQVINTDSSWKVLQNKAYTPCSTDNGARLHAYMVVGPGDRIDGTEYPWGWESLEFDDDPWSSASIVTSPSPYGVGTDNLWQLTPRNIPLMEESIQRLQKVRKADGIVVPDNFLQGTSPLIVPANTKVSILIDQGVNTTAYPMLSVTGGKGASVQLTYTEALLDSNLQKANRNEVEGRSVIGNYDVFLPDGGVDRRFSPLWFRTYRYMQVDVTTSNEPLIINDLYGYYTGYPFKQVARFSSNDKSLGDIWNVGWRTARLCAGETYYDCPYYEQLQYPGDTRIQSLISLYVTGDDRLMRKAILDFYNSRVPNGLTQGRYPSSRLQVIPPYSLYWISMIYDYWMYRQDDAFVVQFLPAIEPVLDWYEKNIDKSKGMLGPMTWWNFTDYTDGFPNGVPPGADDGNSSVITLHLAYTLNQVAQLYRYFGMDYKSDRYLKLADSLNKATYDNCFDNKRNAMADTPEKTSYSQHAGIMAVLSDAIVDKERQTVMEQVVNDTSLIPVTFYYRFYLTQALKISGLGDLYYPSLDYWRDMIKIGLTTFAEKPEPARSDCHAWSASPLYDYFAIICGISSTSPNFKTVKIEPSLGELKEVTASTPHPQGMIKVDLKRQGVTGITGIVEIPSDITGVFVWEGNTVQLKGGVQKISLR
ncbi:alpha-L-rhamnosidase N-terminal domain-containing protein [Dysgonomonas sp. Marseille-P4677]|uniref:alpha-L-rhamnosidase-related protein n=1 Tax=Dysgonomonas sp. Marseille-P4677 TaxID=2364790 RepID=UPI0019147E26|nr:alpha-L-rhamnosidase N-terminal domain-containing protein [Dysgonomonas sp. Marseille-P4677]MBK5719440.1 alpha-L-rhamnosidase N-terminal domain-containing protein [Dysgonomonas sp. Marseille-P4677]